MPPEPAIPQLTTPEDAGIRLRGDGPTGSSTMTFEEWLASRAALSTEPTPPLAEPEASLQHLTHQTIQSIESLVSRIMTATPPTEDEPF